MDGRTDYTILDSDQAAFIVSKNKDLAINIDLLKGISEINSIGWAVEKDNDDLIKAVNEFVKKFVTTKDFRNIWKKTYGIPKKEYDTFIKIVDNQANEILEKGVDYYYKGDYKNSLNALKTSVKFMLYSKKLIKIFDRIYFNLIKKEIDVSQATAMILFDEYANFHPLRRTVNQVKRRYKDMYRDYLFSLRSQRDEYVDKGHLDKAINIQKLVVFLEDYAFEEVNLLRILNMKKTLMFKRKEKVSADDEDNIAMEIPGDPTDDPLLQKNQEVGINNFAQEENNEITEKLKKESRA